MKQTYIPKTKKIFETKNYVVILEIKSGISELYRKDIGSEEPIATHKFSTVLCIAAKELERK